MKFLKVLSLVLLCAPLLPAQNREARVKNGFEVKVSKEIKVGDEDLKITFVAVTEDSRCPEGATCFWAGNGRVRLMLREPKGECVEVDLNTAALPHEYEFGEYKIALAGLSPHPSINAAPKPGDYTATLVVTKTKKK